MRRIIFLVFGVCCIASALFSETRTVLNLGATAISTGDIKVNEPLVTREGEKLSPGLFKVVVLLDSHGSASFVLTPRSQPEAGNDLMLKQNAMNATAKNLLQYTISASVKKNSLVKGIASNIEGEFKLDNVTPSESLLAFNSKQFEATAILGRSLDSKLVDLLPAFVTLDQATECGLNCIEAFVKIVVRNDGNSDAKGKWNVLLTSPSFFVGTVSDIPAGQETTVVSATKLRLACCSPALLEADVHADFYNKTGADSNDANNTKRFTVKLKE